MLPIVLSVDDDHSSHILMRAFLEDEAFCEHFISATNPEQGLEILKRLAADPHSETPNLIFCDIHMPLMSGWEFIEQAVPSLDSSNVTPTIIMLSGTATPEDQERATEHPLVQGLYNKPLTMQLLKELRDLPNLSTYFALNAQRSCM